VGIRSKTISATEEVKVAIQKNNNEKSTGIYLILAELLK
jgi:hypothetical protein